jgi:drug/metabolite transporter (DMT)-like permease
VLKLTNGGFEMSENFKRKWIMVTVLAVVLTYVAVGLYQGFSIGASSIVLPVIVGNLFVVVGMLYWVITERRAGRPIADERSQLVDGKAAKLTLIVGIYFMMLLTFYDIAAQFMALPTRNAAIYLVVSAMFLLSFFGLSRWYYGKRRSR